MRSGWYALAAVVVGVGGIGVALSLYGHSRPNRPVQTCATPAAEEQLLAAYRGEAVLSVRPRGVTGTFMADYARRYCDNIGVESYQPHQATSIESTYLVKGYWTAAALAQLYSPVATKTGWQLIEQADQTSTCGLTVVRNGTRYCEETGVLFCKPVSGVITLLIVSTQSRADQPDQSFSFVVEITGQRDLAACPVASPPPPNPTRT
jgi:hypothetical protein